MEYNAPAPSRQQAEPLTYALPDEAATHRLGACLATILQAGDLVLLSGDLGAGKTTFVRGLLRHAAGNTALDVPSPTFTLVQSYIASYAIYHHYDLYRLPDDGGEEMLTEIGFFDALIDGIALVEWPERLGAFASPAALQLNFIFAADGTRLLQIMSPDRIWHDRLTAFADMAAG